MNLMTGLPARPQAVIFDMDGLMLDSERALLGCLEQTARAHGYEVPRALLLSLVGSADAVTRRRLGDALGVERTDALLADSALVGGLAPMGFTQERMAGSVQPDIEDGGRTAPVGIGRRGADRDQGAAGSGGVEMGENGGGIDRLPSSPCTTCRACPREGWPCARARMVAAGSATDCGTGRSRRTSRWRHFAFQPCSSVVTGADGVISEKAVIFACFCTAALLTRLAE